MGDCTEEFWEQTHEMFKKVIPEEFANLTKSRIWRKHVQCLKDTNIDLISNPNSEVKY